MGGRDFAENKVCKLDQAKVSVDRVMLLIFSQYQFINNNPQLSQSNADDDLVSATGAQQSPTPLKAGMKTVSKPGSFHL